MTTPTLALEGLTIGVTADRRAEEQAHMLVQRGAKVLHGPVLRTAPIEDARSRSATLDLLASPPDVVIANTGVGIRSWLSLADGWGLADELVAALRRSYIAARGPKAAGALLAAGVDIDWRAPTAVLADVVDHLVERGVDGLRVALQLDGGGADGSAETLRVAGATVTEVSTYRWTLPGDCAAARRLIDAACNGRLDAVTFTAAPAVHNLFALAEAEGAAAELASALNGRVLAMCVGPVCRRAAVERGVDTAREPQTPRLGGMVKTLADELLYRRRRVVVDGVAAEVQGARVTVGSSGVSLPMRERALFEVLARRPGAVVPRHTLVAEVWGTSATDDHALEVAVGRLRRRIRPIGISVEAVVRRGYRLCRP